MVAPSCFRKSSINFCGLPTEIVAFFVGFPNSLFFKGLWVFFDGLGWSFFLLFFLFFVIGLKFSKGFFDTEWERSTMKSMLSGS